ncbi:MAG TPA: hypothetical protein VK976_03855, partial [Verrucomicrobiae bacterium]|nr:hypothetical protein [Verrucomicrobiae bacterium]
AMVRLAGDLDLRRADDLTPLRLAGTPSELHPFIASINGLLARVQLLILNPGVDGFESSRWSRSQP